METRVLGRLGKEYGRWYIESTVGRFYIQCPDWQKQELRDEWIGLEVSGCTAKMPTPLIDGYLAIGTLMLY